MTTATNMAHRVCLIIPPSPFLLDERVFMSLGILKVAAVLERAGITVELLDLSGVGNFRDAVAGHLAATDTACFGLTATTPQLPAVRSIVEVLRRLRPQARLILGGPHVTLVHAARLQEEKRGHAKRASRAFAQLQNMVDVLVAGDGELAIFEALGPTPPKTGGRRQSQVGLVPGECPTDQSPLPGPTSRRRRELSLHD
ncbi:MAG: cobalamin-dependent protein [Nitrospiraceae bacterium]